MRLLSDTRRRHLTDWQNDDHRLVVAHDEDGQLDLRVFCTGTGPWRLWCQIPWVEGGLWHPERAGRCGLEDLWEEDPAVWVDAAVDLSKLTPGVWSVRWRICPSREVPIWEPWSLLEFAQVAA
ncbi:hypothetical protein [Frankia sp. AgW1.1]|uniref:hypothetical protein n=1 Tax=Frankia sp. AgW1.1 TaxID=1836971 RepID=UPI001933444A|nr:hypothetical protein [Frankia sp. AgW1.1]MBL7487036.1 hypothetical protein [Frankia sp. AgW1.1]